MDDPAMQDRYRALLLAARNIFSPTSLDDLVENILQYSYAMLQAEACSMFLPNQSKRELVIYSGRGKNNPIHAHRIPWDRGIAGAAFHERKFFRIDHAQSDPRVIQIQDGSGFITRAMLCAPLVDKDECFGVLQVLNPIDRPAFTQLDQDIFDGLTNIVTGALIRFDREKKIDQQTKLANEMTLAMEIQKSYLPPEEVCLPRAEMRVRYRPSRTIGGDFYASIPLPGDRLLAVLGDVSGKGIPAALTTAQITTEMQTLAPVAQEGLTAYVAALNNALCHCLAAGRFVATTFLLHDPRRSMMEIICAGQFEPLRWRNDAWERVEVPRSLALGIFPNSKFNALEIPSLPGEKWLLFSDGINEGRSATGEEYGLERLRASLGTGHASDTLNRAWNGWQSFVDSEYQHDDACLALILVKPPAMIEITSEARNCKLARHFIEDWALTAGYPDLERGRIVLATDEAVTHIILHTNANMPERPILLSAGIVDGHLHLRVRDHGPHADPEKWKGGKVGDIQPGSLGLHLLETVFTVVEHIALPDGNEWHLAKPLA
jgi:sigma-B regulation protein RsbU (phosphoserine phosphatase)